MRHLRLIGFVSSAFFSLGATVASAASPWPSANSISAESQIRKAGCRHDCGGGYYYRQDYYRWRERTFVSRGYDRSRAYYPWVYEPRWYGAYYRPFYDYYDPPRVYGVIEERFVILGSGRGYFPRDHRGYLRHW